MASEERWYDPMTDLPPEGVEVWAMCSDGRIQTLIFSKPFWWLPDRSMYVYYVPKFWKPIAPGGTAIVST